MSLVVVNSECFVRPKSEVQDSKKHHYLSPLALKMLSLGNTQYGLLFSASSSSSYSDLFDNLKLSLSHALVHYYPLAGRLVTKKYEDERSCSVFVDCTKGPGARLIHASALHISVADVTNLNTDVPLVVQSFFDLGERQVNHDGHTRALLSLQMTQLADGLFIGCCINHCIADGTSLSHFLKILSSICVTLATHDTCVYIPGVPVLESPPSLSDRYPTIKLPYMEVDEFVTRFEEGELRDRIFHISASLLARLKAKANAEAATTNTGINLSSYKALCGLIWMSITRARNLPYDEDTTFVLTVNIRSRIDPPLSPDFFATCFVVATATAKAGELIKNGLGSATMMIHDSVESVIRNEARAALVLSPGTSPTVESPGFVTHGNPVVMGGSPWFEFYGVDFGLGKPVAVRTGYTNRADGKLTAFPSSHGPGSIDLQVRLLPPNMNALLLDEEFMSYVS